MSYTDINTRVSGTIHVTIEGLGDFQVNIPSSPLYIYAGFAYTALTGRILVVDTILFILVSFDQRSKKAVFRLDPEYPTAD